jgi:beta-mannosidase
MKKELIWQLGYSDDLNKSPLEFFPANVPGAVQLDYATAYNLPDYKFETNFKEYVWMEDRFWTYKTSFDATNITSGNLFFVSKGIDFKYDIFVNGTKKLSYEGMYREARINLNEFIGTNIEISVLIYPVPKSKLPNVNKNTREEANQTTKPAVSYGWDFHPRLVPLGIWDETYIEHTSQPQKVAPTVKYTLNSERTIANVSLSVDADNVIGWYVVDPNGNVVFKGNNKEENFEIKNPLLWWCKGYGEPNLYAWELKIKDFSETVSYSGKIGFRTVSLEMNEGTWEVPEFPKTRSCPPITLCLNGVNVFVKGSNWVAPEIFYATITYDRYLEQLELVKAANLNFVRCWGGAIVNKKPFYEICDELGIMVWQEFPLGCNNYIATEEYLALLKNEATDIIDRVSKHPCHVIWCGGNELFNSWSGMTDQSIALRTLNSMTLEKTPNIPFLPTSPLMGMAHGSYLFVYFEGNEVIEVMQNSNHTAYTEFGAPSISNIDCLELATSKDKLFPLIPNDVTIAHHAFKAWCQEDTWCSVNTINHYFGESESLEQLVDRGQYLQGVAYRFIFEEARRQKPHCSMAVNWCFNEPWPCVANNSLVCYPNSIKPAFYDVQSACRNVLASARYRKLKHKSNEILEFDLFMLNDGIDNVKANTVKVYVQIGDSKPERIIDWNFPELDANKNYQGPTLRYHLPDVPGAETVKIILSCGEYSSEYVLLYESPLSEKNKIKMLNI